MYVCMYVCWSFYLWHGCYEIENAVSLCNVMLIMEAVNDCFIVAIIGKDSLTTLAVEAGRKALQMSQVDPNDVDLVLMCTSTPEDLFGSAPQVS